MATMQSRKRKSDEMDQQPQAVTPTGSPARKRMKITETQKQALIDNLQLEITERARHLRAHYALQCADLRARIERRVNRIPMAMRRTTMGELALKYEKANASNEKSLAQQAEKQAALNAAMDRPLPPVPQEQEEVKFSSPSRMHAQAQASRSRKVKSPEVNIASDKENEVHASLDTLSMPKNNKRVKAGAPTRAVSRAGKQTAVLSPRSHNSRTLPRSPTKEYPVNQSSPAKSFIARPVSPLKPTSPLKSAASAATSAISASVHGMIEHAKRGTGAAAGKLSRTASREKTTTTTTTTRGKMLPPPRPATATPSSPIRVASQASNHSSTSEQSTTSTNTTVVTKPKRGRAAKATATTTAKVVSTSEDENGKTTARKAATKASSAATATSKKAASAKKVVVAEPATGRRVLRKRN